MLDTGQIWKAFGHGGYSRNTYDAQWLDVCYAAWIRGKGGTKKPLLSKTKQGERVLHQTPCKNLLKIGVIKN